MLISNNGTTPMRLAMRRQLLSRWAPGETRGALANAGAMLRDQQTSNNGPAVAQQAPEKPKAMEASRAHRARANANLRSAMSQHRVPNARQR
eukprot:14607891-Alexandrium_andersonii.AAC.1